MKKNLKYWDWMAQHSKTNSDGEFIENPCANPDNLSATSYPWEYETDEEHNEAIKEIVSQLAMSHRETQVITLMQQGATHRQVANILKIPRGNVSKYVQRLRNKIRGIVRQNPDLGVMVRGIV